MTNSRAKPSDTQTDLAPPALHSRAMADLRFIRDTMAGAASYTAFSGWGLIIVGLGALITGFIAARESSLTGRLWIWIADAGISVVIGSVASALKARSAEQPLFAGPIRKFSLSFAPAVLAGAVMTWVMIGSGSTQLLPGLWLLLYGVGLASAGALSVWIIPTMGAVFFCLGVLALTGPPPWRDVLLWAGFGALHVVLGAVIVRRHGG